MEAPILLGSFNIRRFGKSKMSDPNVVKVLTAIVRRYDILLVQEIVDTSGEAIEGLLVNKTLIVYQFSKVQKLRILGQYFDSNNFQEKVNSGLDDGERYSLEVSPRIGRNKAKEQYAFFYAANRFKVCFYLQTNMQFFNGSNRINELISINNIFCGTFFL